MEKKQGLLQQKYDFAHVLKLTLVATISCFLTGYNIGVVNSSLDNVAETLNWGDLKSTYISLCNALFAVGGTIGSMVSGKLANKYGRRKGMIICDYVSILSCICAMTSFTYTFLFSRLLGGICAGMGVSIAPLYINEIVPQEIKGKLGSLVQFFITFGIFFAFTLCVALPVYKLNSDDNKLWIGIYGFPVVPSIIQLIFYWFVYKQDTPKWLFDSHRTNDLENVLKTIYIQDWEVYLAKIEGSGQVKGETQENANNPGYSALFNIKKYRKPLVLACLLSILQQLSGINTFIFYSTSIYQQITGTKNFANVFTAGLGLFNMLSTMFCLLFIEKYGRKVMLMQGCLGMCACHLALFLFGILDLNAAASLPVMLLYVGFFESSVGPVLWIYCSETLTDRGVGIAVALNWVFTGIIGLFPLFLEVVQISYAFLIFACICAGGFLFILLFIPETKGKTKEEFYNALE